MIFCCCCCFCGSGPFLSCRFKRERICLVALALFDQKEKIMTGEYGLFVADKGSIIKTEEYSNCFSGSQASQHIHFYEKFIQLLQTG